MADYRRSREMAARAEPVQCMSVKGEAQGAASDMDQL